MVEWKVVILGIIISVAFYALFFLILPRILGIQIEYPSIFIAIVLAGVFIGVSGFLPYGWGKFLRYIAYFCLFILILILELNIMKTYIERYPSQEITLENCTTLFGKKEKPENVIDVVGIWSCVTTGYFPSKEGELGWSIFAIFYIILPFAFVWTFIYGMMTGIGFKSLFGNFGKQATILLSFIISMYASRQLFGFFLLDMFGYGAWGLIGVFGAAFFTLALNHMIERWYKIEVWTKKIKDSITIALERDKNAKKALVAYLNRINQQPDDNAVLGDLYAIPVAGSVAYPAYVALTGDTRAKVNQKINEAITANVRQKINELIAILSS
jgi:hypothetical protein